MTTVKVLPRVLNRLIVLVFCFSTGSPAASGGDIAVVVRGDTPVENLSLTDIRKLLMGERQFWNGSLRVTLLMPEPGTHEREILLKKINHTNEAEFKRYWIEKIFRAEAQSGPKIAYSDQMAIELVTAIPGSIAFVESPRIPKNLKQLKIDGKLPGDPDYVLK